LGTFTFRQTSEKYLVKGADFYMLVIRKVTIAGKRLPS